jgi:hypothetical protein
MKYTITLNFYHGIWVSEVSNNSGVILFKNSGAKEDARSAAVKFIEKRNDFKSYDDIKTEISDSN